MADWTEVTFPAAAMSESSFSSTTWAGASAEAHRRYGVGRYGIGAYGQGSATSSGFQEVNVGG